MSNSLRQWKAKLFAYFADLKVLPILPPRAEEPGDVYVVPYGEIGFHSSDWLEHLIPYQNETRLPQSFDTITMEVRFNANLDGWGIAKIASRNHFAFEQIAQVSFDQAVIKGLTRNQIQNALTKRPTGTCLKLILDILQGNPGENIAQGVPWIVAEVWYAKQKTSLHIKEELDAKLETSFKEQLQQLGGGLTAEFRSGGNSKTTMVSTRKSPVAWRPAYISQEHYQKVQELEQRGWFKRLVSLCRFTTIESPERILRQLRDDFPGELLRPHDIADEMTRGKPVEFETDNKGHLSYWENVSYLYAGGWELYWEELLRA